MEQYTNLYDYYINKFNEIHETKNNFYNIRPDKDLVKNLLILKNNSFGVKKLI